MANKTVKKGKKGKTIVITESMVMTLVESAEMSEYKFYNNIRHFLGRLIDDPVNAPLPMEIRKRGINRSRLLREMINLGIIEKSERINDKDENGDPKPATMMVRYNVPKKNFDRKLKRLYIRLFEENIPSVERDEATGCGTSGQYSAPLFGIQRRNISDMIEATTTSTVGDYQYDVPFVGDKESLARKNGVGGSVSVNNL